MAALEKIRSKALFLTIVIGVALLAFIMGDALTSGQTYFGDGNTIANVGSEKIDAIEFQRRYEQLSARMQENDQSEDGSVVQKQVFDQMVAELLLAGELDEVGIYVTAEELTEAMTGAGARQEIVQFVRQAGADNPAQFYDMIFNPGKYGIPENQVVNARQVWLEMEEEVETNLKYEKLQALVNGAIQANDLDRKAIWEENATTATVAYARAPYSSLSDKDYELTEADVKAQYEKDKALYKLASPTRYASIITVDIVPSEADYQAAQAVVDSTYALIQEIEGVDELRNNSDLVIDEVRVRLTDIRDNGIKDFISNAKVGDVDEPNFTGDVHRIVKLLDKSVEVDTVTVNVVMVQGDKELQDSVKALLDGGATVAEVQQINGVDAQGELEQVILQFPDTVRTKFESAGAGYFVFTEGTYGATFCQVTKKAQPKTIYEVANVTYTVYPSTATIENLNDNLQKFILENNTTELFIANAAKAGYAAVPVIVAEEDAQINNLEGSRECVKWLFEANEGSVSPIMKKSIVNRDNRGNVTSREDVIVTLALSEIYDKGYTTLRNDQVRISTESRARNAKKADALIEQYAGKANDIEAYAALMNAKVDTAEVTFGRSSIARIGSRESNLLACMSTGAEGVVEGPVAGNNAVFIYKVVGSEESKRVPTSEETSRQFASSRGSQAVLNHSLDILKNAVGYENKMMRFF